jgi:hypothetical protein
VAKVRCLPAAIQDSAILVGGSTDFTVGFNLGIGAVVGGLLTMDIMFVGKW